MLSRGTTAAFRALLALGLAACALIAAGCTSLPTESQPQAVGTIARAPEATSVAAPTPGIDPFLLVREFVKASAQPDGRHIAARQFLSPNADERWDDGASVTIASRVDVLSDGPRTTDTATYIIRAEKVGQLGRGGVFTADEGTLEAKISVVRINGEWRIDELPPGVIVERPQFLSTYERRAIYFLDATGSRLVPDLRWIAAPDDQLATQLVAMLLDGPAPQLAPGVTSELVGARLRGPVTKADGGTSEVGVGIGGIRLDLQGVGDSDAQQRQLLAAQLVWTLAAADITGPYVLLADGAPVSERLADGWTLQDVASLDPNAQVGPDIGLHALVNGRLVSVTDTAVSPVPGAVGALERLVAAALAPGFVAAVQNNEAPSPGAVQSLLVGEYDGSPEQVLQGDTISRPSWSAADGSLWAVVDGETVVRAVRDAGTGAASFGEVDTTAIEGIEGQITSLRLAADGVRVGLVVGGKVFVAVIAPQPEGGFALVEPKPVAPSFTDTVVALDWGSADALLIARNTRDAAVARVSSDGSRVEQLPSRNLSPPVTAVDASPTTEYVADSRGVLRLGQDEPDGERFWREVSRLMGVNAVPVLPD